MKKTCVYCGWGLKKRPNICNAEWIRKCGANNKYWISEKRAAKMSREEVIAYQEDLRVLEKNW